MLCFCLYISSLYFYTPPRPLSVHLILRVFPLYLHHSWKPFSQRMGVKLLELWCSVSGASPIKVISNSWILPFDGRVIPFGSHSLTLNAAAPYKQDQRETLMCAQATLVLQFILDWCKTEHTHNFMHSGYEYQRWRYESVTYFVFINGLLCYFCRCQKTKRWSM